MSETRRTPNFPAERDSVLLHSAGRPGKIEIVASKPMATQRDLALRLFPSVSLFRSGAIAEDPAQGL